MDHPQTEIAQFFRRFETSSSSGDALAAASHFADVFLAAGPNGAQAVKVSDFALALPKRIRTFASYGLESTTLESVQETRLDTRFVLAETRWKIRFVREHGKEKRVTVDSVFIVDTGQERFRIVFYLAKQDPIALLKAREEAHP
jgi:hypothetical protein